MFAEQQLILVTGASSGIGRAIALECNRQGATVLACGRNEERLEKARLCAAAPQRWHSIQKDLLEDMEQLPAWISELCRQHGRLWGLAHAAGDGIMDSLRAYDLTVARRHFDLNFHVPMLLARGFCDRRNVERGGAMLFMSSASAVYPEKGHLIYGAARTALVAAAKAISQEIAPRGLRVHCLAPGIVDTPMEAATEALMGPEYRETQLRDYPLGFGTPEDIAAMATFLLSEKARWITGQTFVLAGGRY